MVMPLTVFRGANHAFLPLEDSIFVPDLFPLSKYEFAPVAGYCAAEWSRLARRNEPSSTPLSIVMRRKWGIGKGFNFPENHIHHW
jgi:hypothetical protein